MEWYYIALLAVYFLGAGALIMCFIIFDQEHKEPLSEMLYAYIGGLVIAFAWPIWVPLVLVYDIIDRYRRK